MSVEPMPSPKLPFEKNEWESISVPSTSDGGMVFEYRNYTIWGLTARILKHFVGVIK